MKEVITVKFRKNNKGYYFSPGDDKFSPGDEVIVETARGKELGKVVKGNFEIEDKKHTSDLNKVIRKANLKDKSVNKENIEREQEIYEEALILIEGHKLDMKLVDVQYTFDRKKLLFNFTAEGRVDFRELVKDLAGRYHTRIELRQISPRDEARIIGGIAQCGRDFCCHTFQNNFHPVSIKMAKGQGLSLNPSKIYGSCGRLMCCIRYEEDVYKELGKTVPQMGDETTTEDEHKASVVAVNILTQRVKVLVELNGDEKEMREYGADELEFRRKKSAKPKDKQKNQKKDQKEKKHKGKAAPKAVEEEDLIPEGEEAAF